MSKYNYKYFWIHGLSVLISSFIILYAGTKWILHIDVQPKNLLAFAILSFVFSIPAFLYSLFRLKIASFIYYLSLIIGFLYMLSIFNAEMAGWGDLAGMMSLMFIFILGLGISAIVQFISFVAKKYKNK